MSHAYVPRQIAVAGGALLIACALAYRLGSPSLFDDPNEAQYAEVAREMVETGEFISPQLNYVLFLNKPPLLYWMIAGSYLVLGVDEAAARLPGALVTLLTVMLVYFLGRTLYDSTTGLLAALAYAGITSTLIEARLVRPDVLLTAATTAAMLAFVKLVRASPSDQRAAGTALFVAVAIGVMAKGIVAIVLAALPIVLTALMERRADWLARLAAPRHWFWFALLVVPWHAAVALRHGGFFWDYLVNQHLLFFFDWKLPRDSVPVSLATFWAAFLLRAFPWTLLLPLAFVAMVKTSPTRFAWTLLTLWSGGVLLFFSAASSRMEHYVLPAFPAVAVMIGRLFSQWGRLGGGWPALMRAGVAAMGLAFAIASRWLPSQIEQLERFGAAEELPRIALIFFGVLSAASVTAFSIMRRHPLAPAILLAGTTVALTPVMHRGLLAIAASNSSAPIAALLTAAEAERAAIVFEAPIEYQHCAGLNFYLRRPITLLRPPGFVEPTYLAPFTQRLFIDRRQLQDLWATGPTYFVTDPLAPAARPLTDLVPGSFSVVGRAGSRWVLGNRTAQPPLRSPASAPRAVGPGRRKGSGT